MEPIVFFATLIAMTVCGLCAMYEDIKVRKARQLEDEGTVQRVIERSDCIHERRYLHPVYTGNQLVATLCAKCDGQLDPKVIADHMTRELDEIERQATALGKAHREKDAAEQAAKARAEELARRSVEDLEADIKDYQKYLATLERPDVGGGLRATFTLDAYWAERQRIGDLIEELREELKRRPDWKPRKSWEKQYEEIGPFTKEQGEVARAILTGHVTPAEARSQFVEDMYISILPSFTDWGRRADELIRRACEVPETVEIRTMASVEPVRTMTVRPAIGQGGIYAEFEELHNGWSEWVRAGWRMASWGEARDGSVDVYLQKNRTSRQIHFPKRKFYDRWLTL